MFRDFFHRLLNPHCPECKIEDHDEYVCDSCEVLKEEINYLRLQNQKLLETITNKPKEEVRTTAPVPITPRVTRVPWAVKRQQMEQNDREKAEKMRQESIANKGAAKPDNPVTVEELEKEMDMVSDEREAMNGQ